MQQLARQQRREDKAPAICASQRAQSLQDAHRLRRQRHDVRWAIGFPGLIALHHFRRDRQRGAVKVEPGPFHVPQLTRTQQQQR